MSVLEEQITICQGDRTPRDKPAKPERDCWQRELDARRRARAEGRSRAESFP
jgi:hypothetical protein